MSGIVFPITMNAGRQAAHRDNQADQRFAQDQKLNDMRMTGLQTQQTMLQRQMAEDEEDAPIRKMKRDAEKISHLAKYAVTNLDRVADKDVPAYMAKVLSEMPVFGQVEARGNRLFDGEKAIPMGRAEAEKLLATFADPDHALKLKMEEAQYVDSQGNITTTTAANAQRLGLSRVGDVKAGYDLNAARIGDKYAEEEAQLGLTAKQAQIDSSRASAASSRASTAKSQQEKMAMYTDGKTVQTMTPEEAQAKGFRLLADHKAEQGLHGGGPEPYDFSKQTPEAAAEYAFEAALQDSGFKLEEFTNHETGITTKKWTKGGEEASAEDIQKAVTVARQAVDLMDKGGARSAQDAYKQVRTQIQTQENTPPVSGAKKAPDGKWYVQTGTKPDGKAIWAPVITDEGQPGRGL